MSSNNKILTKSKEDVDNGHLKSNMLINNDTCITKITAFTQTKDVFRELLLKIERPQGGKGSGLSHLILGQAGIRYTVSRHPRIIEKWHEARDHNHYSREEHYCKQ